MNDTTKEDSKEHAELIALYNATVADLAFFKRQQWAVAYYALAIDAALVASPIGDKGGQPVERFVLVALIVAVACLCVGLLIAYKRDIKVRRSRLEHLREKSFGSKFREAWNAERKREEPDVPLVIISVVSVGAIVASWMLVRSLAVT